MFKKRINVKNFLFRCGIDGEAFTAVSPLIWQRNVRTLTITTILSFAMGSVLLLINIFLKSGVLVPYLFLMAGSAVTLLLLFFTRDRKNVTLSMTLCYWQMLLVFVYASILSTQESNYAVPATSVIVSLPLVT